MWGATELEMGDLGASSASNVGISVDNSLPRSRYRHVPGSSQGAYSRKLLRSPGYIAAPQASSSAAISSTVGALFLAFIFTLEAVPIYSGARNVMAPMAGGCACPTQYSAMYAGALAHPADHVLRMPSTASTRTTTG